MTQEYTADIEVVFRMPGLMPEDVKAMTIWREALARLIAHVEMPLNSLEVKTSVRPAWEWFKSYAEAEVKAAERRERLAELTAPKKPENNACAQMG